MSCKGATTLSSCHIFYFLFPVSAIILLWTHMRLTGWLWYCFEGPCSTSCHQKQPFSHRGSIHALATASYFFILLSPVTQLQKSFDSQPGLSICFLNIFSLFLQFSSVQFSRSVVSHYLRPHELQHARPSCPSPTPKVCSNSCRSSRWCHPIIPSSGIPFSLLQSFPASGSLPKSQFFTSGGQSVKASASASVLPMNI